MTMAPDSPPDLTSSKSSKSSSFHSSSQLDQDTILSDISHFEDIGLDDDHHHSDHAPVGPYTSHTDRAKRAPARTVVPTVRNATMPSVPPKDRTALCKHPTFPFFAGRANGLTLDQDQPEIAGIEGSRRGLMSPSTSSLSLGGPRRRSPSPAQPGSCPMSPNGLTPGSAHLRQQHLTPTPMAKPHSRRSSWQPSRKSVQELEEECHDSDEDVPDEAVIWNVPISPRPPRDRSSSIASTSAATSASNSPERKSPLAQSVANGEPVLFSKPPKRAVAQLQRIVSGSLPTSPTKPTLPRGSTTGSVLLDPQPKRHSNSRVKSWTAALSDLSEEAKILTEALEAHADDEEQQREEKVQKGTWVPPAGDPEKKRSSSSVVELPPLRKTDAMIDPLPISKEKEAVLTRTRPSWLPPKSQKEEKKHIREYQRMMAFSLEAGKFDRQTLTFEHALTRALLERKKAAREKEALVHRDNNATSILRIWDQHVLPDWDRVIREPRTRELWWRGVPPRSRGTVWQRAVGNELELSGQSYAAALRRAKDAEKASKRDGASMDERQRRHGDWFRAMKRDIRVTFPELRIFQVGGPLHDGLLDVLMAYAFYRSDVGYIHGTHLMTALLLLNLQPAAAFLTLANLLNRPLPLAFLTADAGATQRAYTLTLQTLAYKFPLLHEHLTSTLAIPPAAFLEPLFSTLMTRALSLDVVARVWDVYVFEGDGFLVRAAVAALGQLEPRLRGSSAEVLGLLGWGADQGVWDVGSEEEFMTAVRSAGKEGSA